MEEIASPAEAAPDSEAGQAVSPPAAGPIRAYDPTVLAERQPRITDLIPVRPLAVIAAVLTTLGSLGLVVALHVLTEEVRRGAAGAVLAPLDLGRPASLGGWVASLWLAAAAGLALLIFRIRAHRVDDYQGRYRIWLWAALALLWLSLDVVTGLHLPLGWLMARSPSHPLLPADQAATLAWMGLYGLLFGALGLRLALEIRASLVSAAALVLAGWAYLTAAVVQLGWLGTGAWRGSDLLRCILPLAGHWLLLATVGWYARHVVLDAMGRLLVTTKARAGRSGRSLPLGGWLRRARAQASSAGCPPRDQAGCAPGDAAVRSLPDPGVLANGARAAGDAGSRAPRPTAAAHATGSVAADAKHPEEPADTSHEGQEKLSRAERRRLRRLEQSGEQRRAA